MGLSENLTEPVGLLQSGGLSSLAVGIWLAETGVPTRHYIADIGQVPRRDIDLLAESLRGCGAEAVVVDIRARMAQVAADLLRYRARHDGGYWNTTGASRFVLVEQLAPLLAADGCRTLAHGCVGGGNDQRRFARYVSQIEPGLRVYPPWTDPDALTRFPDRQAMAKAVNETGLRLDAGSDADRSTDANLAGVSHESADLERLTTPVTALDPRFGRWPSDAPGEPESVTVEFQAGRVVDVDGSGPSPLDWIVRCNEAGARHGVWLRDVVERRIIGTVCRGVYEAPGLELLHHAWSRMLQASLDAGARQLYDQLAQVTGAAMYEARWLDPAAAAARAAIDVLLADVSGRVVLVVHRGVVTVGRTEVAAGRAAQQTRFDSGGHFWSLPVAG
ncbi:MAG TPA: argininosuccinate synthase domain-containing protein [Micromonosporaceae bacterium]